MNHIYRSIWNATLGCWVAAPETASSGGKASRSRTTYQPPVDGVWASASRFCLRQRAPVWVAVLALCGPASAADIELSTVGESHDISVTGSQTVNNFSGVAGTTLMLGGSTLTFGTATSGTFAGEISGTGGLVKQGAGTQTLFGANTYSGGTALNAGTLVVGHNNALGTGHLNAAGGTTLDASSSVSLANQVNLTGNLTIAGSADLTLSGALSGVGGLTKTGHGTLALNGINGHLGNTVLNAGTLSVGNYQALGLGTLTVGGAATLNNSSALTLPNQIMLNAGLTWTGGTDLTLSGQISGTGRLTKNGAATLTLNANNFYSGGTTLNAGTLVVGSNAALGSGALTVAGAGKLDNSIPLTLANSINLGAGLTLVGNSALALVGGIDGTGGLTKNGATSLTLNSNNTYSGGTTLNAGTLTVGNNGALGTGALTVAGAAALDNSITLTLANAIQLDAGLTVAGSNNLTLGGVLSSSGGLTKNGTATLTLNGANTYAGDTTVNEGTLTVNGAVAGHVAVASGATLAGTGSVGTTTVQNGAILAPGSEGTGALTVKGNLSMASGSTLAITAGTPGANLQTPGQSTSVSVAGHLDLNNVTLDVTQGSGFGPGLYRLFEYSGTLMGSGITAGLSAGMALQNLTASQQINLLNTQGMALNLWNANGLASGTAMGGGSGTWSTTSANWTDATGLVTNPMYPAPGFAVFDGAAGTVTIDNAPGAVQATGLQFASNGYVMDGGALTLVADAAHPAPVEVRVGNGSAASIGYTATLNNVIAGSAGLNKTGAGTLVLTGTNSYSGGTTVTAGTLSLSSDTNLGAASDALTLNGGTLQVSGTAFNDSLSRTWALGSAGGGIDIADAGNDFRLGSALSGTGSLRKTGAGTLTLTDANSYTGGTTIAAGTLALSGGGALSHSGAVELSGTTAVFDVSDAGAQTIGALSGVDGSSVRLGSQAPLSQTLTFGDATSTTFAGTFSGSGALTKTGSGTLTLAGDSSAFAGSTLVQTGSLQLDNAQLGGALTLANGATLSGTGRVGSLGTTTLVQSGATIAPGTASTPYGTLTVAGHLIMDSSSTLRVAVDPTTSQAGKLSVGGTAVLDGTLQVDGQSINFNGADSTYTVVAAQSVTGQFKNVAANFAFLTATADYADSTKVDLKLTRKTVTPPAVTPTPRPITFSDLAQTGNQRVVAQALEGMPTGGTLHNFVLGLPEGAPPLVFSQLSGDSHAAVQGSLPSLGGHVQRISQTRLHNNLTTGMRAGAPIAQSDGPLPASAWPTSKALPAWVEVVGHRQTLDGNNNAPGVKQNVYGLFLGADEEVGRSGWRVGGSLGYTNADAEVKSRDASADISNYSASVYTGKVFSHGMSRVNILGGLAYTHHRISSERSVASLGQNLKANYTANTLQLFGEVGYAMGQYSKQGVEPFAGINVSQQRVGSLKERGGFAALRGQSSRDTTTSTTLGVRAHGDFKLAGKDARLKGSLGWRHAFGDVTPTVTVALEGSDRFTVAGAQLARNTALVGMQADVALSRYAAFELGYQGEYGSGTRDHAAYVKLRWAY